MHRRLDFSFSKYSKLEYTPQNWNEYETTSLPQSEYVVEDQFYEKKRKFDQNRSFDNIEEEMGEVDLDGEYDEEEFQQSPFIHPVTPLPVDPESEKKHQNYGVMNSYRRMLIHMKPTSKATESTGFPELSSYENSIERYMVNRSSNRLREIRNKSLMSRKIKYTKIFQDKRNETNVKALMVTRGDPQIMQRQKLLEAVLVEDEKNTRETMNGVEDFCTLMIGLSAQLTGKLKKANESLAEMERKVKEEEERKKKAEEEKKRKKEEAKKKKAGEGSQKTKDGKKKGSKQQQPKKKVKKNPYEGLKNEWMKTRIQLTRPPKNCHETAYAHYLLCVRALIMAIGQFNKIDEKKDETFKQLGRKLRTTMNQVGTDLKEVRAKYRIISKIINGAKKKHEALYYFGLVTIATRLVKKGSVEISRDKTKHFAYSFGYLAYLLSLRFRQFRYIFLGRIYETCPWAIPWFPIKPSAMDVKEYKLKRLKYETKQRTPDGLETELLYFGRMEGTICLYSAYSVIPMNPHPHGIAWTWRFITHLLNIEEISKYTPSIVIAFLTIAGYSMHKCYGGQFIKLLKLIEKEMLPKMAEVPGADSSAIGRIKLYLEFVKKNKAPKEIEFCNPKFWDGV